jgi:hypothetical protein
MNTSAHMTYAMQRGIQQLEKDRSEVISEKQARAHPRRHPRRKEASKSAKQEEMSFAAILQQVLQERD